MSDDSETLAFACPHCGGPLHVIEQKNVECEVKHRFTMGEVLQEQARRSSQASWSAVRALQERAQTSRWVARDPELYGLGDVATHEASADEDERTARLLQTQAQALDLTLWRISQATHGDGTPIGDRNDDGPGMGHP